jgi:apolipoprotein N-acyltransferase
LFSHTPPKAQGLEAVIVQPNIDPYNEKFDVGYQQQFSKMLRLARTQVNKSTAYLILPETFITGIRSDLNEDELNNSQEIQWFRDSLMQEFPQLKIITGGNSYRFYRLNETPSSTARRDDRTGLYYDVYNTALFIDQHQTQIYHKSKLVPGVEKMPFPALMKPLEGLAINLGGTMGSLGTQDDRTVFVDQDHNISIAPVICYESVYGDFVTGYTEHGASLICIITNDGWWDDTPGYYQHLNYGRLRAIENRREIARSANTGISCFIDQYGNIRQATAWWEPAVIKGNVMPNSNLTFFSRWGDLISYSSVALSILLVLFYLFRLIRPR